MPHLMVIERGQISKSRVTRESASFVAILLGEISPGGDGGAGSACRA